MVRMMRASALLIVLGLVVGTAGSVSAQTPDITGEWELDKSRSLIPERTSAPIALTFTVELKDGVYTIKRVDEGRQGARIRYEESFTTDGESKENETEQGNIAIMARWQGKSLIMDRTRQMSAGSGGGGGRGRGGMGGGGSRGMTYTTTYTLSDDGKLLIAFIDFGRMETPTVTLAYAKK
jgi:hypothetical protein